MFTGWARWLSRGCLETRQWGGGGPLPWEGAAVPPLHASSPAASSWPSQHCFATPLSSQCLNSSFLFFRLVSLLPWNPCKKRTQQGRGSFSGVQMVMCPAVPDAGMSVGCWVGSGGWGRALSCCWASCLSVPPALCDSYMVLVHLPCLPRPDERGKHPSKSRQQIKSHKADNWVLLPCLPFWCVCAW